MNLPPDRTAWLHPGYSCHDGPVPVASPRRLVLLGPPGSGKGTLAAGLHEMLGACPLSTGDVLRAAREQSPGRQSPALRSAYSAMRRGELVSDDVMLEILRERATCLRCRGGFLLDGYPRTLAQAVALEDLLRDQRISLDAVFSLEVSTEQVIARLSGRRMCPVCQAVYHIENRKPVIDGRCDDCRVELVQREDDRPEAIRVRMRVYESSSRPVIGHFETRGKLIHIAAEGSPQQVLTRALDALTARTVDAG